MAHILESQDVPKYRQLVHVMIDEIRGGVFAPGSRFRSEHEWAQLCGLSRHTVRKAVDELDRKGYLRRKQGCRTFVRFPPVRSGSSPAAPPGDIGLLVPCVTISLYPEIIRGVEDVCLDHKYHIILCNYDVLPQKENAYLSNLIIRPIGGVIACPSFKTSMLPAFALCAFFTVHC